VKSKNLFSCLFLITLTITSCSKESVPGVTENIVGKWKNTAVYSDPAKGGHGWETVTRFHEFVTFNPDAKFTFFTDTPASTGTYSFNGSSKDLLLYFEADQYGNSSRSEIRKVETMTDDKLIVSFVSPADGMIYKTEYGRIN
jgi:hypothetical protein